MMFYPRFYPWAEARTLKENEVESVRVRSEGEGEGVRVGESR